MKRWYRVRLGGAYGPGSGSEVDPLLSGALIALISAATGFFGNYVLERRRQNHEDRRQREAWGREDRTRHHQERLDTYRDMLAATGEEKFGFVDDDETMGHWLVDRVLSETVHAVGSCHSEVLLFTSSSRVRKASTNVHAEALRLKAKTFEIHGQEPLGDRAKGAFLAPVLDARTEFLEAVREELGIEPETG